MHNQLTMVSEANLVIRGLTHIVGKVEVNLGTDKGIAEWNMIGTKDITGRVGAVSGIQLGNV